jgi:tetratricopeptide (TPR) repeat protein
MSFSFLLRVRSRLLPLWLAAIFLAGFFPAPSRAADPVQLNSRGVELIRQGQFEQAVDLLEQAHRKVPNNRVVRDNLALSYLGLGTRQIEAGRYEAAAETLRKGRRYATDDARFRFFRGLALFQSGRHQEAESELNEARAMEENPETLHLLGKVYYASGRLEQAIEVWREALETGGWNAELAAMVDRTWEELRVEQTMKSEVGSNFVISYDGRAHPEMGVQVLEVLEAAYNEIGRDLDFYPQVQIPVLLYTQRDFSELTGSPDWSGGLYDGKIRIPVGGVSGMNAQLRAVLYHEYVHVVVRYLTSGRCPVWLNEGLAEVAGRQHQDTPLDRLRRGLSRNTLIPFERLESSFEGLPSDQAELAYQQSYSLVHYMLDQFHWYKMAELLRALGEGKSIARAVDQVLGEFAVDYAGLQAAWRRQAGVR